MSRMLKPAAAGLAISSLCLSFVAEVPAQNAAKKKTAIKQTQAEEDPPARAGLNGKGQAPPVSTKSGQIPRPQVDAMREEKPDPALEKVLKDWEQNTSLFKKLVGEFRVFKYDPIFEVEKRAKGKFAHEAPDKGSYERLPADIPEGTISGKLGKDKQPYELRADEPERWVCTGKEVFKINDKERTYEKFQIPPEAQGQNIIDGPLPFLFGMKADQAKKRYKMKLKKKAENEIWLEVIPRRAEDAGNWQRAIVIIDAERFVPNAVKLFDPTGAETVHLFSNVEINPTRGWRIWAADPFAPKLSRYKQVLDSDKADSIPRDRLIPPANSRQSSGPAKKTRAATESFDRSADVSDAPAQRKKTATNRN